MSKSRKKQQGFVCVTISNRSETHINARVDNEKVTREANSNAYIKEKHGRIGADISFVGAHIAAGKMKGTMQKTVDSVAIKVEYGWTAIPPYKSQKFNIIDNKQRFYASVQNHAEDMAFRPRQTSLIWDGEQLLADDTVHSFDVESQIKTKTEKSCECLCVSQMAYIVLGGGLGSIILWSLFGFFATLCVLPMAHSLKLLKCIKYVISPMKKEYVRDEMKGCLNCWTIFSVLFWLPFMLMLIVAELAMFLACLPFLVCGIPWSWYHLKSIFIIVFPGNKYVDDKEEFDPCCVCC